MTEQDVNNTLHSFNVIKQLQTSGQSFEDFFEENKGGYGQHCQRTYQ